MWGNQGQKKEGYPRLLVLPSFRDHPKSRCGENVCGGGGERGACVGETRAPVEGHAAVSSTRGLEMFPFFFCSVNKLRGEEGGGSIVQRVKLV